MKTKRRCAQELRQAIDCLPVRTREAMLEGIEHNEIIVGAYTDYDGRVCPMLAAHRHGGRTSLASFARAWDRYTGAGRRPRPATERELRTLTAMLEASLFYGGSELRSATAEHHASAARTHAERKRRRRPTGEKSRLKELGHRHGWAWLRVFRRYDDWELAMKQLEDSGQEERERELV